MLKFQSDKNFAYLYVSGSNSVLKSEPLAKGGSDVIAKAKLRVWAKRNGMVVA